MRKASGACGIGVIEHDATGQKVRIIASERSKADNPSITGQ